MNSLLCITVISASLLTAQTLRMEDFFTDVKPVFPPLSERETLPEDQIKELQNQWEHAKKTGLLKDRYVIWKQLGDGNSSEYKSVYLKYNNPEIISIVVEMLNVEYDCYTRYKNIPWDVIDNMDYVECAQQRKPLSDEDEFEMDYTMFFGEIAISTMSPEIFDILLTPFLPCTEAEKEYFLTHNVEDHLIAILMGKLKNGDLIYTYNGIKRIISLYSEELIVCMLIKYPELGWKYRDKVFALIEATINSKEERVARHARRLKRCMDIIVSEYEKLEGEPQVKVEGERHQ